MTHKTTKVRAGKYEYRGYTLKKWKVPGQPHVWFISLGTNNRLGLGGQPRLKDCYESVDMFIFLTQQMKIIKQVRIRTYRENKQKEFLAMLETSLAGVGL